MNLQTCPTVFDPEIELILTVLMRQSSGKSFYEFMTLLSYQMLQRWEYLPHKPVGEKRNGIESSHRRRRGQTWVSSGGAGPVLISSCKPDLGMSVGQKEGGALFSSPSPVGFATCHFRPGARKNGYSSWGCIWQETSNSQVHVLTRAQTWF